MESAAIPYAIKRRVEVGFDEAVERVTAALAEEGFGILTTIDIQAKMKEKLGHDMDRYVILGACKPPLAWQALGAEPDIGVLMPCNVCVYERDGTVVLSAMEPRTALQFSTDATVCTVAEQASLALERAVAAV